MARAFKHQHDGHVRLYLARCRQRARNERIAAQHGRVCAVKPRLTEEERAVPQHVRHREKRIQKKRDERYQRQMSSGRTPRLHDAHVRSMMDWVAYCAKTPHSAHVSAWRKARSGDAWAHRYRTDPEFNAAQKVRTQLRKLGSLDADLAWHIAEEAKAGRFRKTWPALLGYDGQQLVAHLRGTLPAGRTWQEFMDGYLHIDHIKPRALFDLTTIDSVRECWRLDNLRLLDAIDNMRKGARVEEPV